MIFTPDRSLFLSDQWSRKYITSGLFIERDREIHTKDFPQYTLKGVDRVVNGRTYPSLKRLYLETEDPTEYDFANLYLYDYPHWKELCGEEWFKDHLYKWRDELEMRLKAKALQTINQIAQSGGKESLTAAKFLYKEVWADREKDTPGRPTKKRIQEEAKHLVKDELKVLDDLKRLGLVQ